MIFTDDCTKPVLDVWKGADAQTLDRIQTVSRGGPNKGPFRRLTLKDGDNAPTWTSPSSRSGGYGERVELGRNSLSYAPFLYRDGDEAITTLNYRLLSGYPIAAQRFQTLMQMKQTGPSSLSPCLALRAFRGRWELINTHNDGTQTIHWTTPAVLGRWEKFQLIVGYGAEGEIDFSFRDVRIPTIRTNTLIGGQPSHLRCGYYRDSSLSGGVVIDVGPTSVA